MSDFLSKFSKNNYSQLLEQEQEEHGEALTVQKSPQLSSIASPSMEEEVESTTFSLEDEEFMASEHRKHFLKREKHSKKSRNRGRMEHDIEYDPNFRQKQWKKRGLVAILLLLVVLGCFISVYWFTHVSVPDFVGKPITQAREWAVKQQITLDVKQEFSLEQDANVVLTQNISPQSSLRKGTSLQLTVSKGPDLEEQLSLPDFSKLTMEEANQWVKDNKATQLKVLQQFDEKIPEHQFIKIVFASKNVDEKNYKRMDKATVYYSKGKEVFEKNIEVLDFKQKTKAEVESWAKSNDIQLDFKEQVSASIEQGLVVSQSIAAGEKMAKKETLEVTLSLGKGTYVPDFSVLSAEEAAVVQGLSVIILHRFSEQVSYGQLISQSIEPKTQLTEKDDKTIRLVYSYGQPYLSDLRGKKEGELQKYFYDEFRSKGASVTYSTYYVDSNLKRGTVVEQNAYETHIPLRYEVSLGISNGKFASPDQSGADNQ